MAVRHWLLTGIAAGAMAALAQGGERPLQKLFGPAAPKAKASAPAVNARRLTEIGIELAWLADPVTFPYYLEARIEGTTLTVRGFVPDKLVRDHALRIARVRCTENVADAMKEHPSLRVRRGQTAAPQLRTAVVSSLRKALPRVQAQRLQVECTGDGKVTLRGPVQSAEQKLAASVALRRLYGCSGVENLTQAPGAPDLGLAKAPSGHDIGKGNAAATNGDNPPRPQFGPPMALKNATTIAKGNVPTVPIVEGPNLFPANRTGPPAKNDEPAKGPTTAAQAPVKTSAKLVLTASAIAALQKRVEAGCPTAKAVKLEVAMNKLRVELTVASEAQISPCAEMVFNVPELADYRDQLELEFKVVP